jgi:hypothetical protein
MQETRGEGAPDQGLDDWLSRLPGGETPQPAATPPQAQAQPPAEEVPEFNLGPADWLSGLSDEPQASSEEKPAFEMEPSTGEEVAEEDWMSKLSSWQAGFKEEEGGSAANEPAAAGTEDTFGWLGGLGTEGETPSEQPDQASGSGMGLTGFFSDLEGAGKEEPAAQELPAAPEAPGGQAGAVFTEDVGFEWGAPESQPAQEKPSSGFGLTDFLTHIEEPGEQPEQTPPAGKAGEDVFTGWDQQAEASVGGEIPSWISGAPETPAAWDTPAAEQGAGPFDSAAQAGETSVYDWLQGLEGGQAATEAPELPEAQEAGSGFATEGEIPAWLQETGAETPSTPAEPMEASLSGLPAWLSSEEETPSQAEVAPFEQPQGEKSDLPAWLLADEAPEGPAAQVVPAAQGLPAAEELPAAQEAPAAEELPAAQEVPAAQELPAAQEVPGAQGLPFELEGAGAPPAFTGEVEEGAAASAEIPDWLSGDFATTSESAVEEEGPAPSGGEAELPGWFASFDQAEIEKTQPSRVTGGLRPPSGQLPSIPAAAQETPTEPAETTMPAGEAEGPDWLREFQSTKEETGASISPLLSSAKALESAGREGDQPFTVDLPEWLGEEETAAQPEAQPGETGEQVAEPSGEQLAQAELPDWVREMRPLESILPGEVPVGEFDQRVEKAGPLAGMRGVLPVEDMATRYRKPPIYSVKLHVTEKQRTQATLLESILSQEPQSLLIPPARALGTGVLMRVLVAVFLLIALAFPVVYNVGLLAEPQPERFPAESQMFEMISERLQSNSSAPVLVAVEYEPGLSGEMRMAADAVIAQLVAKNARIALVSTSPTGPALGQQLIDDVNKDYENSINLGYLPGGTISLVDFAQLPRRAAPATLDNQPAWGADSLLKDVDGLKDFSQVIVLTDRAEVGRAWVEQVQPQMELDGVPLFVVASMQAAPLLQPYVESGQIAGMTSGMLGGAVYAQLTNQVSNRAFFYLSAYQVGVLLAFVVVLVGGVISGGLSLFKRGDKEEE